MLSCALAFDHGGSQTHTQCNLDALGLRNCSRAYARLQFCRSNAFRLHFWLASPTVNASNVYLGVLTVGGRMLSAGKLYAVLRSCIRPRGKPNTHSMQSGCIGATEL